jgi:hypothetical protein
VEVLALRLFLAGEGIRRSLSANGPTRRSYFSGFVFSTAGASATTHECEQDPQ